jgi:hypothetical protein
MLPDIRGYCGRVLFGSVSANANETLPMRAPTGEIALPEVGIRTMGETEDRAEDPFSEVLSGEGR